VASQQDLERLIVKKIIGEVHDGAVRISDSGQRELHLIVRERIPTATSSEKIEVSKEELNILIAAFAARLSENAPDNPVPHKRTIIRKTLIGRVIDLFSDFWPFGE